MDIDLLAWKKNEIIFVSVVLLVIFGVSFFQLRIGQMKTRDAQRKSDVELVSRALNAYLKDYEILPLASADGKIISCGDHGSEICEWGQSDIVDFENIAYLKKIPQDPQSYKGKTYFYEVSEDRQKYKIYVTLELCKNTVECKWYAHN